MLRGFARLSIRLGTEELECGNDDQKNLRKLMTFSFYATLSGLVKAVNTAVDLIVAHFGTSRDPDVKVGLLRGFD